METATETERATIGGAVPGYCRIVRPVVRVESWGPIGVGLQPIDPRDAAEAAWSAPPDYTLTTPNAGARLAVRAIVTGRTVVRWGGDGWVRGRLELCGDGGPSRFLPCMFLAEWAG